MRILAMTSGDFRTADSGIRLRDYHLCSALSAIGALDVLTFVPHQATAGERRAIDARVMLDQKPSRFGTLLTSLRRGDLYHGRLFDPRNHRRYDEIAARTYDVIYCSMWYSIPAARDMRLGASPHAVVLWDTHNYDPAVWDAIIETGKRIRRRFAVRQSQLALATATAAAQVADATIATTDEDAAKLRGIAPSGAVHVVPNGGEVAHWAEAGRRKQRVPGSCIIFGGLGQDSTRRGIEWFLGEVWRDVLAANPDSTLTIAGRGPTSRLARAIGATPGVRLVANPVDVASVVGEAWTTAAPQVWGTGSKIKMFEAVAISRPVIASPAAVTGLPPELLPYIEIAEDPASWARAISRSFERPMVPTDDVRSEVVGAFDWSNSRALLSSLIDDLRSGRP